MPGRKDTQTHTHTPWSNLVRLSLFRKHSVVEMPDRATHALYIMLKLLKKIRLNWIKGLTCSWPLKYHSSSTWSLNHDRLFSNKSDGSSSECSLEILVEKEMIILCCNLLIRKWFSTFFLDKQLLSRFSCWMIDFISTFFDKEGAVIANIKLLILTFRPYLDYTLAN